MFTNTLQDLHCTTWFLLLYGQMCWGLQISVQYLQLNTPRHSMFVFLDERLHCNSQNRRLIVFNSLNLSLECLAVFCHIVDLITSISAQRKIKTEMNVGKQLNRRVFVWLAFIVYALKEKGVSYYEIQWQKCSLLSPALVFFSLRFSSLQWPLQVPVTAHLLQRFCLIFLSRLVL